MAHLALLLLSIGAVCSFNPLTDDVTYDFAKNMINQTVNNAWLSKYIPADLKAEMSDLIQDQNKDELQTLINLHNNFKAGKIQPPQNRQQALAFIQEKAPASYNRVQKLLDTFNSKYDTLSSAAKNYVNQLERAAYKAGSKDFQTQFVNAIHMTINQNDKWNKLPENVKQEFRDRWPEICAFYEGPEFKTALTLIKSRSDKDLIGVAASLMKMFQKKLDETSSDSSSSDSAVQTQDEQTFHTQVEAY